METILLQSRPKRLSEPELVVLLRTQKPEGITYLYHHYAPTLYGILQQVVQAHEMAEELLQDTLYKIWSRIDQYDPQKGRLFTWMRNLARNLALDAVRSKGYRNQMVTMGADVTWEEVPKHPIYLGGVQDQLSVQELLRLLKPYQRQVLELHYWQGYSYKEIAEQVGVPLPTVKSWARKALISLRKHVR